MSTYLEAVGTKDGTEWMLDEGVDVGLLIEGLLEAFAAGNAETRIALMAVSSE